MLESKESKHLLSFFETGEMGLEFGHTHLYYCLYEDRIQVIREFRVAKDYSTFYTDEMSVHTLPYGNAAADVKAALSAFLKQYLINVVQAGAPFYEGSDVYTKEEWEEFREWFSYYQKWTSKLQDK